MFWPTRYDCRRSLSWLRRILQTCTVSSCFKPWELVFDSFCLLGGFKSDSLFPTFSRSFKFSDGPSFMSSSYKSTSCIVLRRGVVAVMFSLKLGITFSGQTVSRKNSSLRSKVTSFFSSIWWWLKSKLAYAFPGCSYYCIRGLGRWHGSIKAATAGPYCIILLFACDCFR